MKTFDRAPSLAKLTVLVRAQRRSGSQCVRSGLGPTPKQTSLKVFAGPRQRLRRAATTSGRSPSPRANSPKNKHRAAFLARKCILHVSASLAVQASAVEGRDAIGWFRQAKVNYTSMEEIIFTPQN